MKVKQQLKSATLREPIQRPIWYASLSQYGFSSSKKALWQLLNTLLPYLALWTLMIFAIRNGWPYIFTFAMTVVASAFLVRIFIIFHDCVHGSFFPGKKANTFLGHILGLLLFTPFDDWRFSHLRHHATYADLDARGFGDIWTMTKAEYTAASRTQQLLYRLYRNPLILVCMGAIYTFVIRFRFPTCKTKRKERMSVILTNLLITGVVLIAIHSIGWKTYLLIQIPVLWMAGAAGIWLFYVQHQFKGVYWAHRNEWNALRAAMQGCSFYKLPSVLRWFSGNIGYHHIHHMNFRIPNYRLKKCYDAVPELHANSCISLRESFSTIRMKLWDEENQELVGFA